MEEFEPKKRTPRGYWLIWLITLTALCGTVFGIIFWFDNQQELGTFKEPQDFTTEQEVQASWDLSAMYKDQAAADQALADLASDAKTFESYSGKLSQPESFKKAMKLYESLLINEEKIRIYANLRKDTALEDGAVTDFLAQIEQLDSQLVESMAYFKPELSKLSDAKLNQYVGFEEAKDYRSLLESIIDDRASVLSEREDRLLGLFGDLNQSYENNYQAFWNRYDVTLDSSVYDDYYDSDDDRRYEATKASLKKQIDAVEVLASNLEGKVKYDNLSAKAYEYGSDLEMVLSQDGITLDEYKAYEQATENNLPLLHRWISLKKRMLGLERPYKRFDQQLSVLSEEQELKFEDAKKAVRDSLEPLGPAYLEVYDKAIAQRWVDVYPRDDKYTGSYTWGAYASHPYILINYENQFVNASTFAHEMGHAANGYLSAENQPFTTYENSIFKAEIASTTNEVLFLEHQLKTQTGKARQEILVQYINLIVETVFEQMKASEFEKLIHDAQLDGKDLDGEFLVQTWKDLNAKYYGKDYEVTDLDGYDWTNIDHLYWNFYMYKYATGLASGYSIAQSLLEQPEKNQSAYMAFLKSGSSKNTLDELNTMKVDLTKGEVLEKCYKKLGMLMDELETTIE